MPTKRPLIGLTGPSTFTSQCMEMIEDFFEANYVMLYHAKPENITYWVENVDAIVLAGGVDIHPSVYGESIWNDHNLSKFDISRDAREVMVIDHCLKKNKPMLGICRGHQLLGIMHGLGFIMDLSASGTCHSPTKSSIQVNANEPVHSIQPMDTFYKVFNVSEFKEREIFREVLRESADKLWVNSFHHQGVVYNNKINYQNNHGVDVLAIAPVHLKVTKYIIELMSGKNWLSCQWHPENDWKHNTVSAAVLKRFKDMITNKVADYD